MPTLNGGGVLPFVVAAVLRGVRAGCRLVLIAARVRTQCPCCKKCSDHTRTYLYIPHTREHYTNRADELTCKNRSSRMVAT